MKCPNNDECIIEFISEENDSGDPSTPYFSSWLTWIYDSEDSWHVPECPPLTDEQITQLEKDRNNELDYSWSEPI